MKKFEIVGIGNAIVDVISTCDDSFLDLMGIEKGIMQLVEKERGETLYSAMETRTQTPGGAVANTIAGIGALGLKTGFVGKVRNDALGQFYAKSMNDTGIEFLNPPMDGADVPTSRSMIFVTPDGERSMNTYLGISAELGSGDVQDEFGSAAKNVFLEGYLFDKDKGKEAFKRLSRSCRTGGGRAGIAISDPFCVERHRDDFFDLIKNELDYVIGNEAEVQSLYQTEDTDAALAQLSEICPLVVCTRSGNGVSAIQNGNRVDVSVETIVPVDATGAGDQFAAGFLYGILTNRDLETACRMGCISAGEVIRHVGPRPEANVFDMFKVEGLV